VQRAYMGMVFIHGDIIERLPAVTSTDGLEYKITSTIQKMNNKISALLNLKEKIKVKLVQSSSLMNIAREINLEGLNQLEREIDDIVDELNKKTYDQLEYVYIDPSVDEVGKKEIAAFRRFELQWPEFQSTDGNIIKAGRGILAIGIEYDEKSVERNLLKRSLNLTSEGFQEQFDIIDREIIQSFIEENIGNIIDINEEIGYLSTHGALPLSSNLPPQLQGMQQQQPEELTRFNSLLSESYSVKQVSIEKDGIPESIDTLIISAPKENFSDWELLQIDQFLMKGKSLAIFLEAFNEMQQPQQSPYGTRRSVYIPLNTGLQKLINHYGAKVKKSYIMDENCFVNTDSRGGETPIYFAPLIKNEKINHKLDFLRNIKGLIMLKASPVETDKEKIDQYKLKAYRLFSSSNKSWELSGRIDLNPFTIRPPANKEEMKSYPLAYIIEGEFPSYFKDKPVPEKPKESSEDEDENEEKEEPSENQDKETEKVETKIEARKGILNQGKPGKIFIIGTAEILKDNVLDEEGTSSNSVFVLNTLDYLNNRTDIAVMRSKNQTFNPIRDTKVGTRTFLKILNIGGLPVLFIVFGFIIWFRRKSKRKMIQNLFLQKK
ncbi:MAG: Gldg family protein, partial [Candidatus Aminicenantaceae bacterium]